MGLHFTEVSVMRVVECSPLHHLWMGKDGIEQDSFAIDLERRDLCADVSREGGGVGAVNKLYMGRLRPEAQPLFDRNGISYVHPILKKGTPLTCLF